jgi:shikimate kinase
MHSADQDSDRIVLIGMMGSGKSTVGRLLSARLGWRYVDNDDDVRRLTAQEPSDVISSAGEEMLHAAEATAFLQALAGPGPVVVAAAAAVVLDSVCAQALSGQALVVYLRARPETLRKRIGSGAGRREDATDLGWLAARYRERDAVYRALSTLTIDVDERSPDEVVELIAARVAMTAEGLSAS